MISGAMSQVATNLHTLNNRAGKTYNLNLSNVSNQRNKLYKQNASVMYKNHYEHCHHTKSKGG